MAILLDERIVNLELTDLEHRVPLRRPDRPPTRSPGWHESDLLRDIALEYRWLKVGDVEDQELRRGDYPWRWALGQAWEEFWFSFQGPETGTGTGTGTGTIWQPGERVVDGIACNADGITTYLSLMPYTIRPSVNGTGKMLEETKHTEKRVRTGQEFLAEKLYMHQGRAYVYCYLPDAREVGGVVRWTVMHYLGNRAGSGPVCKQYVVRFTAAEVVGTWDLLVARKKLLEDKGILAPRQR
jgi:hypothetical protein